MTENNQKNQQSESDIGWVPRIVTIIITAIVIVVGINFFKPTTTGCFWGCDHGGPVSFSKETYNRATLEIRSLIEGKDLDTSKLANFLAYEVEPQGHLCSDATIETCCTWWLNSCQGRVHQLLNMAYSNAKTNHYIAARFFLSWADYVSSKSGCFDCSCESWYCDDYVYDISY